MRARISTTVTFDPKVYATEYGLNVGEDIAQDAEAYLQGGVQELLSERFEHLGWGIVGEVTATIHDKPVRSDVAANGLPTGFEHTHLADLVAIKIALGSVPLVLIYGTLLRLENELKRRPANDVSRAFADYWATSDQVGLPRPA
jgi:hypothetical protein